MSFSSGYLFVIHVSFISAALPRARLPRSHIAADRIMAEVGVEPTRPLRAGDFKSPASAIPPLGRTQYDNVFDADLQIKMWVKIGRDDSGMQIEAGINE